MPNPKIDYRNPQNEQRRNTSPVDTMHLWLPGWVFTLIGALGLAIAGFLGHESGHLSGYWTFIATLALCFLLPGMAFLGSCRYLARSSNVHLPPWPTMAWE